MTVDGRDCDAIADHVREAERAYSAKTGTRIAPRTPWEDQRLALVDGLQADSTNRAWPARDAIPRCAWHVLDHAWEIEDKSECEEQ